MIYAVIILSGLVVGLVAFAWKTNRWSAMVEYRISMVEQSAEEALSGFYALVEGLKDNGVLKRASAIATHEENHHLH